MLVRSLGLLLIAFATAAPSINKQLCSGYVPENNLSISTTDPEANNMTETEFNRILDVVEAYYAPIIAAKGGLLEIDRNWESTIVNASAQRIGDTYRLNMYGGLARHQTITGDGYMMVACHELGHHIGGAPKSGGWVGSWATDEGGADYFATLRCLRNVFTDADNAKYVAENAIDPFLKQRCEEVYTTQSEENFCIRSSMAGMSGALFFASIRSLTTLPKFDTPDPKVVTQTSHGHPEPQCRLDTYFQGALCLHDMTVELSDTDPTVGTCNVATAHTAGLRPLCWFKP